MVSDTSQLPIDQIRSEYLTACNRPCLIKASTGSGKSTRIPIWLIEEEIPFILVEPRRVVVRSLYEYLKIKDGKRMKSKTGTMGCVVKEKTFGPGVYFDVGYPVKAFYTRIFIKHKK